MNRQWACLIALALLGCLAQGACARTPIVAPRIEPAAAPNLTVTVTAGELAGPDGNMIRVAGATLTFDPPETRDMAVTVKAPQDKAAHWDSWQPWPGKYKGQVVAQSLKPAVDEERTQILGGLFRQIPPESIRIASADGSKTFRANEDYVVNADWAQIGGLGGRLGTPGEADLKASYTLTLQRLDLVQAAADGTLRVKKGTSRIVCPQLPEPDAGCAAVAGVYIAPWPAARNPWYDAGAPKAATEYAVTEHEIFPVRPAAPVAPVNPAAVARTLGKLRGGKPVTIAVTGASIELGAEAPAWWADLWTEKNLGYASRVIVELRRRFPKSAITGVDAFQGGTTTEYGLKVIEEKVLPSKADLLLVGFGGNDCAGPEGGKPNNPPEKYKEDMRAIIGKAKGAGMDVIIVVTMQQNPWLAPGKRWPAYREKLLELSKEENVALADVYTEWLNQATRGVPPFSQLHNWLNHPGKDGHKVYADTVLRFFEAR